MKSGLTNPDASLETIFQDEDTLNGSDTSHDDDLKRSEILREDLEKAGLLSRGLLSKQTDDVINPEAFEKGRSDESPPDIQGNHQLSGSQKQSNPNTNTENQYQESEKISSQIPYASEDNDYSDDERDWIVGELANAGTGSQVPQDDFVWSDTDEDLMISSAEKKSPTIPPLMNYVTTEAVSRDDRLSNQNNENIMMMTPPSYISTTTPTQYRPSLEQGVDLQEPDYLTPEFGTDSSGEFLNENGVSGNFGDIGDEINFEVLEEVKRSKVPRPTAAYEKEPLRATEDHTYHQGNTAYVFAVLGS